ncbi:GNAT family N-acetyltransferase [Flammeovirga sp. MY04]|uniref:GNAT family N-acetyltransferase n=1 Tax=Flammeovirga sp. MY04 TaxID=1191459 RepID=UPI000826350E|nr:GNAT family N-acetyltransferase [Flammeovirga sp. MY04]ANQ52337.2 GNAT family N-acetyltransferase [Flammeovirga sp. MY04]
MIIKRLSSQEIDFPKWDNFINRYGKGLLYMQSWFLELFDENWGAFIVYDKDQMIGVLPYQYQIKWGIMKIINNPFVNELGIIYHPDHKQIQFKLFKSFKEFQFISSYKFNVDNTKTVHRRIKYEATYHLSLNKSYVEISAQYNKNLKRKLKKAEDVNFTQEGNIEDLIQLFKENVAHKINQIEENQYDLLRKIYKELKSRNIAQVYATELNAKVISAVLMIQQGNRLIYYFAASSEKAKSVNAQAFLIDQLIKEHSERDLIFDFEGGDIPGLAQFYSSFGADRKQIPVFRQMLTERLKNFFIKK